MEQEVAMVRGEGARGKSRDNKGEKKSRILTFSHILSKYCANILKGGEMNKIMLEEEGRELREGMDGRRTALRARVGD